jgi:predicted small integral membrane protein
MSVTAWFRRISLLFVIVVGYEVFGFVERRRLHFYFQSTREMRLFVALLIISFLDMRVTYLASSPSERPSPIG